jgi:hypothetical protein
METCAHIHLETVLVVVMMMTMSPALPECQRLVHPQLHPVVIPGPLQKQGRQIREDSREPMKN